MKAAGLSSGLHAVPECNRRNFKLDMSFALCRIVHNSLLPAHFFLVMTGTLQKKRQNRAEHLERHVPSFRSVSESPSLEISQNYRTDSFHYKWKRWEFIFMAVCSLRSKSWTQLSFVQLENGLMRAVKLTMILFLTLFLSLRHQFWWHFDGRFTEKPAFDGTIFWSVIRETRALRESWDSWESLESPR